MSYKETAEEVLKYAGGAENVNNVYHCATRLRFTLNSSEHVDIEKLKSVNGVLNVLGNGTQICDRGTMAKAQAEVMLSMKIPPEKVIIGHMTSCRNLDEIRFVMDRGFTAAFDQFGILSIPGIPDDEEKTANLLALLREGYEDRIVLSHDTMFDRMGYISKSKPRYPDMVYKTILPYLRENGISEDTIRRITRENLLRILDLE